jgi:hypothetical protein
MFIILNRGRQIVPFKAVVMKAAKDPPKLGVISVIGNGMGIALNCLLFCHQKIGLKMAIDTIEHWCAAKEHEEGKGNNPEAGVSIDTEALLYKPKLPHHARILRLAPPIVAARDHRYSVGIYNTITVWIAVLFDCKKASS